MKLNHSAVMTSVNLSLMQSLRLVMPVHGVEDMFINVKRCHNEMKAVKQSECKKFPHAGLKTEVEFHFHRKLLASASGPVFLHGPSVHQAAIKSMK